MAVRYPFLCLSLVAIGCGSAADESAGNVTGNATIQSPIREITCNAEAKQRHAEFHFRLSADGKVREATVMRGYSQGASDAKVAVKSVTRDGGRLRVEATEGANHYRFTISESGFAAKMPASLDAEMEESNDRAVLEAPEFACFLSDAEDGFAIFDPDAKRLYETLRSEVLERPPSDKIKVVDTKGPFRLYCNLSEVGNLCSVRIPALITKVDSGLVTYSYELDENESRALNDALGERFTTTAIYDAWSRDRAAGAKVDLACDGARCSATYTVPDRFYQWLP